MKKYVFLNSAEEMNEHLNFVNNNRIVHFFSKPENESFGFNAWIENKMVYFSLTYERAGVRATYIFRKDGQHEKQKITGGEAFRIMSQYYKIPRVEAPGTARPFLYKNGRFENKRFTAWEYDMNSSYAWGMTQTLPDTSEAPRAGKIKEGFEVGFIEEPYNDFFTLRMVESGYSSFVFKILKENPLDKFSKTWYNKKKKAKDENEKFKAKNVLTFSVGMLQRHNPFLRAAIMTNAENRLKSFMDDQTIYANTDSIVSLKERPDIPVSEKLGDFKLSNFGKFAFVGFNYQWNNDVPSYRGIPKTWFKTGYDILTDPLPLPGNIYDFDFQRMEIVKVKWK